MWRAVDNTAQRGATSIVSMAAINASIQTSLENKAATQLNGVEINKAVNSVVLVLCLIISS